MTRRQALRGLAVLAAADKVVDGGYAAVSRPGRPDRGVPVLPPGAGSIREFNLRCVGCGLCVRACPEKVLKPSGDFLSLGRPVMDFSEGHCRLACDYRCGEVCPEGAIAPLRGVLRRDVHAGVAVWRRERCLRAAEDPGERIACTACSRKCPVKAIHIVGGVPVVDAAVCVGCGACEHVCPSRPEPAIFVRGLETQRVVVPVSAADLLAEMRRLVVTGGAAAVVARNGVVERRLEGRGIAPILEALDANPFVFANATVADRVVGRSAAAIYVVGRAKKVVAPVMSEGARRMLEAAGIAAEADELVPRIVNREGTGQCPMDSRIEALEDPAAIVGELRRNPRP